MDKKIWLFGISFLLFMVPVVSPHDFNFTVHNSILHTNPANNADITSRIKAYSKNTTSWYVTYQYGYSGDNRILISLDEYFDQQDSDVIDCYGKACQVSDCGIRRLSDRTIYSCAGTSDYVSSYYYGSIWEWNVDNNGVTTRESSVSGSHYIESLGICQDQNLIVWERGNANDNDPRYSDDFDFAGDYEGKGTIDIVNSGYHIPDDLQIVSCGGGYHMIIRKGTGIFDLIYDWNYGYQTAYTFTLAGWNVLDNNFGVWVDPSNQTLYITQVNLTHDKDHLPSHSLINIQAWSCDAGYTLSPIYSKTYNQTSINSSVNFTTGYFIAKPYLTKDVNGVFHLFYHWNDTQKGSDLKVATDYSECTCSEWIGQDSCTENYQKYNRTCFPSACETNTTYWAESDYCGRTYNESLGIYSQKTRIWTDQNYCESDWVLTGQGVAECSPPSIKIPDGCSNANATVTVVPVFDTFGLGDPTEARCGLGRYNMTICNPTYDCFRQSYSCQQLNTSLSTSSSYEVGEYATGYGSIFANLDCKCGWALWDYGISKYKIRVSLTAQCTKNCENEWFCMNPDYKAYRNIDCSFSNETYCNGFGCADGVCLTSGDTQAQTYVSPDWWYRFFTSPESPSQRFIMGFIGSLFFGIIGLEIGSNSQHAFGFFIFFFAIGWSLFTMIGLIPSIITLIILVSVGGYFFLNKLGGK